MYAEEAIKFAIIGLVRIGNQSALPALQEFNNLCKKSDATMGFNICNIVESAIAELSR